jgi:hypothetical protein
MLSTAAAVADQGDLTVSQEADGFAGENAGLYGYNWKEEAGARAVGHEGSIDCPHLKVRSDLIASSLQWAWYGTCSSRLDPASHFDGNSVCGIARLDIREG